MQNREADRPGAVVVEVGRLSVLELFDRKGLPEYVGPTPYRAQFNALRFLIEWNGKANGGR
jgi:hypothetical protein